MTVKQGLEKFFKNWVLFMNGERRLSFIQVSIPPRFVEPYDVTNFKIICDIFIFSSRMIGTF